MRIITEKPVMVNGQRFSNGNGDGGVEPKPAPLPAGWSVMSPSATATPPQTQSKNKKSGEGLKKAGAFLKESGIGGLLLEKARQSLGLNEKSAPAPDNNTPKNNTPPDSGKGKNNTKTILLVVGGLALVGTIIYLVKRKK